jgi:hypothetical protein
MSLERIRRPLPLKWLNRIGRIQGSGKGLELDRLITEARKKAGLKEFNDDSFIQPLQELIRAINDEARLNMVGRLITRIRLINVLVNRLKIEEYIKKHPEVMQEPVV